MVAGNRKPRFSQRDTGFCFFVGKTTGTLRKRVALEIFGRDGTFNRLVEMFILFLYASPEDTCREIFAE
jgi:hypothetical protein